MIYLTSFAKHMNLSASVSVIKYSAAVYQPSGCRFLKLIGVI
jgi:hypothetical protein